MDTSDLIQLAILVVLLGGPMVGLAMKVSALKAHVQFLRERRDEDHGLYSELHSIVNDLRDAVARLAAMAEISKKADE